MVNKTELRVACLKQGCKGKNIYTEIDDENYKKLARKFIHCPYCEKKLELESICLKCNRPVFYHPRPADPANPRWSMQATYCPHCGCKFDY